MGPRTPAVVLRRSNPSKSPAHLAPIALARGTQSLLHCNNVAPMRLWRGTPAALAPSRPSNALSRIMRPALLLLVFGVLLLSSGAVLAAGKQPFAMSVVFGDSFTDYWRMYNYRGRFLTWKNLAIPTRQLSHTFSPNRQLQANQARPTTHPAVGATAPFGSNTLPTPPASKTLTWLGRDQ